ncbi:hypothetical protein [Pantanalinema sp. GBBB05]|uniref:hypothetical protein n=1 Tax=Pantanalinema sp. GBBB05 TaxID=2604139 RepID=UPI001DBED53F|nr:hypothetical protein [Pantanalinema sp. GBBB05]
MLPQLKPLRILCLFAIVGITAFIIPITPSITSQMASGNLASKQTLRLLTQFDLIPSNGDLR